MKISVGSKLPKFDFLTKIGDEIMSISYQELFEDKTVALFAMPGAFTPTCSKYHVPSIIATEETFKTHGVDTVAILTTNDPHVMAAWGMSNNIDPKKIVLLSDSGAEFTQNFGMIFSAPQSGLIRRSLRYALIAKNGVVTSFQIEKSRGVCDLSSGESLLKGADWS